MKEEMEVKTRKDDENNSYKKCFLAVECVDWLVGNRHQPMTREEALGFARRLESKAYISWVGPRNKKRPAQLEYDESLYCFVKKRGRKGKKHHKKKAEKEREREKEKEKDPHHHHHHNNNSKKQTAPIP